MNPELKEVLAKTSCVTIINTDAMGLFVSQNTGCAMATKIAKMEATKIQNFVLGPVRTTISPVNRANDAFLMRGNATALLIAGPTITATNKIAVSLILTFFTSFIDVNLIKQWLLVI